MPCHNGFPRVVFSVSRVGPFRVGQVARQAGIPCTVSPPQVGGPFAPGELGHLGRHDIICFFCRWDLNCVVQVLWVYATDSFLVNHVYQIGRVERVLEVEVCRAEIVF